MKRKINVLALGLVAAAMGLAALVPGPARAEEIYLIDGSVWDHFQGYLDKIGHGRRPGAYAITTDGYGAYYVWCPDTRCRAGSTYSHEAKTSCEKEYDTDCVTFAIRDEIKVKYEIRK